MSEYKRNREIIESYNNDYFEILRLSNEIKHLNRLKELLDLQYKYLDLCDPEYDRKSETWGNQILPSLSEYDRNLLEDYHLFCRKERYQEFYKWTLELMK